MAASHKTNEVLSGIDRVLQYAAPAYGTPQARDEDDTPDERMSIREFRSIMPA